MRTDAGEAIGERTRGRASERIVVHRTDRSERGRGRRRLSFDEAQWCARTVLQPPLAAACASVASIAHLPDGEGGCEGVREGERDGEGEGRGWVGIDGEEEGEGNGEKDSNSGASERGVRAEVEEHTRGRS